MRIGVTCDDGPNDEATLAERALAPLGHPIHLPATPDLPVRLREAQPDLVLNLTRGRGAPAWRVDVPRLLASQQIPFTGSDAETHAACVERPRLKAMLAAHGIPTAGFTVVHSLGEIAPLAQRAFPVAVRRTHDVDSCFATLVAHDFDELESIAAELLAASSESILVERFLPGESFACTVLGNGAEAVTLPVVRLSNDPFTAAPHAAPSPAVHLHDGLAEAVQHLALRAVRALGCRDLARVDIRLSDAGVANVCSVDPLPPLTGDARSATPVAAREAGVAVDELVQRCVLLAAERAGLGVPSAPAFARLPRRTPPHARRVPVTPS